MLMGLSVVLTLLGAAPVDAMFGRLSPDEVARAVEFGRGHPVARWPGTELEWQDEILIRFADAPRLRTIQVTFLTPWLRLAIAAWEDPLTFRDPASPAVLEFVGELQSTLLVQIWFVPRDRGDVTFRRSVEPATATLRQAGKTISPRNRRSVECRTTRFVGCLATEFTFSMADFDTDRIFTLHIPVGQQGFLLGNAYPPGKSRSPGRHVYPVSARHRQDGQRRGG